MPHFDLFIGCNSTENNFQKILRWKHPKTDPSNHSVLLDKAEWLMFSVWTMKHTWQLQYVCQENEFIWEYCTYWVVTALAVDMNAPLLMIIESIYQKLLLHNCWKAYGTIHKRVMGWPEPYSHRWLVSTNYIQHQFIAYTEALLSC